MKQLIVDLKTGRVNAEEIPSPALPDGYVLIQNTRSVISPGTEKMLVDFGKSSLLGKARQQKDRVQDVLYKIKTDGLKPALEAVSRKLGKPLPLGYSSCGLVLGVGKNVADFRPGDRVASNGGHSEIVSVPKNLVAKIPDGVSDESAAFTVLGAIALQGMRLIAPTFGETIIVTGLGLIGQLAVQLLKAAGCNVIGIEPSEIKRNIAAEYCTQTLPPSQDIAEQIRLLTNNRGADAVLITASAKSDDVISQAAQMCRKRGRVVLTGVVGLDLRRSDFYEKEITFQVSASYGPGRYDAAYEEGAQDYPEAFVRWTAGRNFEAVLRAMATGQLNVQCLISARSTFGNAASLYDTLDGGDMLACIIEYAEHKRDEASNTARLSDKPQSLAGGGIGIIGAGNFTEGILLPLLSAAGAPLISIAGSTGLNAARLARKYSITTATTDYMSILQDDTIAGVIITTRHNLHAKIATEAVRAGKHVFVEKPLALTLDELYKIEEAHAESSGTLTAGFNRRFAPLALKLHALLNDCAGTRHIIITCNAGQLPKESWINDPAIGGGRIKSEACHFIDLAQFIAGARIIAVESLPAADGAHILLRFGGGHTAAINYLTTGNKGYDKERVEVYCAGRILILQNWRSLTGYGFDGFSSKRSTQDKGHAGLLAKWLQHIKGEGGPPIPFDELMNSATATLQAAENI